ncbi:flippase-like domain-containing protein [Amycolatopsis rhizosphaerae]|uniref:Flippase-like domain-containing protein n=1 Tax=Amycolatopsis rhizosphaerae TaxID=2053003 RepID=A0A558B5Y5_9PSEU|nr:flippase-like domain-containing protein [Amycolatopsis rhizosphaerae]
MPETRPILREVLSVARRPRWRLVIDWVLAGAGLGIASWQLAPTLAAAPDLRTSLAQLNWFWVAVTAVLATLSLVAYGELHRRMLVTGGAHLSVPAVQAINFIGNSLAQTVPSAGSAAGAAYTVAALRFRGVDTGLSLWATTMAALFSASVLVLAGPLVLAFDGLMPFAAAVPLSVAVAVLAWALWELVQRPRTLHWIAGRTVAVARHLPVVRTASWVARQSTAAQEVSDRIARLRPNARQWWSFFAVTVLTWGADYTAVATSVAATGEHVPWPQVALGYLAVQASIGLELTPAGAGPAEAGLLAALAAGGVPGGSAAIAVVLYRVFTWLGLAAAGWIVFAVTARKRVRSEAPLPGMPGRAATGTAGTAQPAVEPPAGLQQQGGGPGGGDGGEHGGAVEGVEGEELPAEGHHQHEDEGRGHGGDQDGLPPAQRPRHQEQRPQRDQE